MSSLRGNTLITFTFLTPLLLWSLRPRWLKLDWTDRYPQNFFSPGKYWETCLNSVRTKPKIEGLCLQGSTSARIYFEYVHGSQKYHHMGNLAYVFFCVRTHQRIKISISATISCCCHWNVVWNELNSELCDFCQIIVRKENESQYFQCLRCPTPHEPVKDAKRSPCSLGYSRKWLNLWYSAKKRVLPLSKVWHLSYLQCPRKWQRYCCCFFCC